jgi:AhpC/TSA family
MKCLFRFRVPAICLALLSWSAFSSAQHAALDLEGRQVNPLAADAGKIVVLVFVRRDCPVSGRYAPVVQQISEKYRQRARFWLVYPDKSEMPEEIRKSVAEYGYRLPVLRDPDHALVKLSRVQITPEVAVFDRNRRLVYDGRIDDWYVSVTRARPAPTTHELEDAMQAAEAGQSVARKEVRAVGCYIADLE